MMRKTKYKFQKPTFPIYRFNDLQNHIQRREFRITFTNL